MDVTGKEKKGLEIADTFIDWMKRLTALSAITAFFISTGWALYAEPKIDEKIRPLEYDILYIKFIQEELVPPDILKKVKSKMERLNIKRKE